MSAQEEGQMVLEVELTVTSRYEATDGYRSVALQGKDRIELRLHRLTQMQFAALPMGRKVHMTIDAKD